MFKREYNYKDILLLPKFSELNSRSEADTSIELAGFKFKLPIVPSNMSTVVDAKLCKWLASQGYFYIMHRFGIDNVAFAREMKDAGHYVSISLGVNKDSYSTVNMLKAVGITPDFITIDIAHGHSTKMRSMLQFIKFYLPNTFVIAGNTCTAQGVDILTEWGADAVKVGVGPGSVCTTKLETGFSRPQFSAVLACSEAARVPIIADGGVEHNGDIAKALVSGGTLVMIGRMLAGFNESPGELNGGGGYEIATREFYGSASEHNKGVKRHIEGKKIHIPLQGSIVDMFEEITQSLRSSISYAGGKDLSAFRTVDWTIQS